jgi:hypothetical protein
LTRSNSCDELLRGEENHGDILHAFLPKVSLAASSFCKGVFIDGKGRDVERQKLPFL